MWIAQCSESSMQKQAVEVDPQAITQSTHLTQSVVLE